MAMPALLVFLRRKFIKNLVYLCGIVERNHKKNNSETLARMI